MGEELVGLIFPVLGKSILFLLYPLLWWFVKIVQFSIINFQFTLNFQVPIANWLEIVNW